jgi:serine/threonine protein kinase
MGVVYLCYDEAAGIAAAVKVIRPEHATNPQFRARLRHEVAAARRVPRFCTAPVLAGDLDADPPWVATEYIDAPTLDAALLEQGRLGGAGLEAFAAGVAVALREIHRHGVIHRDLKPSNIMLSPVGPRVIDFGIARVDDSLTHLTQPGGVVGTPAYMAPEQLRGESATAAVDVFAWASVVTYAATGRPPFGTGEGVMHAIVFGEPDLGGLDGPLRDLVTAAFHKDPAARPSAADLVDSLSRAAAAATSQVLAAAASPAARFAVPTQPPAAPSAPTPHTVPAGPHPAAFPMSGAGSPHTLPGDPAWSGTSPAGRDRSWQWLAIAAVALVLAVSVASVTAIWLSTRDTADGAQPPGDPAGDTDQAGDSDQCLLGTWTMTSSRKVWQIAGLQVEMTSESGSIRYFRPDGTALLDFADGQHETGTAYGIQYEMVLTGTISFDYHTSGDDTIETSNQRAVAEQVLLAGGAEVARERVTVITEPFDYECGDNSLTVYEPTGASKYTRTSTESDQ